MAGKGGEAIDVAARDFIHELYDATNGYAGRGKRCKPMERCSQAWRAQ
jgi:hypothetical protein